MNETCPHGQSGYCRLCVRGRGAITRSTAFSASDCIHLGSDTGEVVTCPSCPKKDNGQGTRLKILNCTVHKRCTIGKQVNGIACCANCPDRCVRPIIQVEVTANGIGDHLLGLTTAEGLRRDHPHSEIVYACKHRNRLAWVELFNGYHRVVHPALSSVFTVRPHDHERGKDLMQRGRWEWYAHGCDTTAALPEMRPLPSTAVTWAEQHAGLIVLAPWSVWPSRNWPLNHWLKLEQLLLAAGKACVILDNQSERNLPFESPKVIEEIPIRVAALLKASAGLISNDSGMAHLAGLLNVPTLALCGPILGHCVFGIYPSVRVLDAPNHKLINLLPVQVMSTATEMILSAFPESRLAPLIVERDRADWPECSQRYATLWKVVRQLAPRRIVEIGVRAGYSAWTMLDACPGASLIGIDADIDPNKYNSHGGYRGAYQHAERICHGRNFHLLLVNSHKVDRLPPCDLVYIDGDHTEKGCYADLLLAERSGALTILLDDYDVPNLGVHAAVDRFRAERPTWQGVFHDNGSTGLYKLTAPS